MAVSATLPADPDPIRPQPTERPASLAVRRVVLTGFMGSGKTTVGRLLAMGLQWEFADLDTCVEQRLGCSVPEIFAALGEEVFRRSEVEELRLLLAAEDKVIALGGGAPATAAVRELLRVAPETCVVHLHAPFSLLYERCRLQTLDPHATARPLLGGEPGAAERFKQRVAFYQAVAHWEADAAAGSPATVAEQLGERLRSLSR